MVSDIRQTILREYTETGFAYEFAPGTGKRNHLAPLAKKEGTGNVSRTKCGRNTVTRELRTRVDVLSAANNLCRQCLRGMSDDDVETLALMASASSRHETTAADIRND